MMHDVECGLECSVCHGEWRCYYVAIGCDPYSPHYCPKCDPDPTTCRACGRHGGEHDWVCRVAARASDGQKRPE